MMNFVLCWDEESLHGCLEEQQVPGYPVSCTLQCMSSCLLFDSNWSRNTPFEFQWLCNLFNQENNAWGPFYYSSNCLFDLCYHDWLLSNHLMYLRWMIDICSLTCRFAIMVDIIIIPTGKRRRWDWLSYYEQIKSCKLMHNSTQYIFFYKDKIIADSKWKKKNRNVNVCVKSPKSSGHHTDA